MIKYSKDEIQRIFETADDNLNCNTAYPVFKGEFMPFRKEIDLFKDVRELSFYIHVPFCRQFCSFCEYTRFLAGDRQSERHYLAAMKEQMESFLETHRIDLLKGFDIGGGTPTAISDDSFYDLMNLHCEIESRLKKSEDYEKSIEISFPTLSHSKTLLIGQAGFKRVSAGLQYVDSKLDQTLSRESESLSEMREEIELLHHAGVEKVNLDIMYGMPGQDDASVMKTLEAVMFLHPEQVTVYETRYNRADKVPDGLNRDLQYRQYCKIYDFLTGHGYKGRFGRNTFSLDDDKGVSSYINSRMTDAVPYKGFGPSAQSMSDSGISYEALKNTSLTSYPELIDWSDRVIYDLPPEEMAAKYICIALYSGRFNTAAASRLIKDEFRVRFSNEIGYLLSRGLIEEDAQWISLTRQGFRYYGAIGSLFWSDRQKKVLLSGSKSE